MTIKELKKAIEKLPDQMEVFIKQTDDEYPLSLVANAKATTADFYEDSGPPLATDVPVFVIDDEH